MLRYCFSTYSLLLLLFLLSFAFNTGTFFKIFALDFDFCFLRFMFYFVVVVSGILVVVIVVTRAFFLGDLFMLLLLYIYKCLYNIYI